MEILSKTSQAYINSETNYKLLLGQMRQSLSEKNKEIEELNKRISQIDYDFKLIQK